MEKVFVWTEEGLLCPNGCGRTEVLSVEPAEVVPEVRLLCPGCGHLVRGVWEEGS